MVKENFPWHMGMGHKKSLSFLRNDFLSVYLGGATLVFEVELIKIERKTEL